MHALFVAGALYAVFAIDALFFCYAVDNVGHNHHKEDHLFNLDGSPKQ